MGKPARSAAKKIKPTKLVPRMKPYKHQAKCLKQFGGVEFFANLSDCGTGKSWITINDFANLWADSKLDGVLVLAPNGVHTNWTLIELPKHMPEGVCWHSAAWSATPNKEDAKKIDEIMVDESGLDLRVFTMNWEALQTKRGLEAAVEFLRSCKAPMIVADESDCVKTPKAARTKALLEHLKPLSKFRRILTATPVNNAPFDLYSQFSFLSDEILDTPSFYAFKAQYAEMLPDDNELVKHILEKMRAAGKRRGKPQVVARGPEGKPKYRNLDQLNRLIAPYSFRVAKSDCLDLPPKVYKTVFFELTAEQKRVYKKAKDECRLEYENAETPFTKLVALSKLAQITSGYYIHPNSEEPVRIEGENPKLDLLAERVRSAIDSGEKVIVWARYRVEIDDICRVLKRAEIPFVQYHGGIKKAERVEAIERFERGDAQVFVGNQQAGGTGITLIAASTVIYFSNNWSFRDRYQSEDRAHRIGQTKSVEYINLVARRTIDEIVLRAVEGKSDVSGAILDAVGSGALF